MFTKGVSLGKRIARVRNLEKVGRQRKSGRWRDTEKGIREGIIREAGKEGKGERGEGEKMLGNSLKLQPIHKISKI